MINVLELFSGTGSIGKVCKQLGWNVVSVDMILPADHQVDIMEFNYKQYPKDRFDIVWASPPCTNYSRLKNCWYGRKLKDGSIYTKEQHIKDQDEADKLVLKSLEIIDYFNPHLWFLENPQTGNLKNREIMKGIPFYDVDYCMYSDWGYKKRTRIWTNKQNWNNLMCDGSGSCGNMIMVDTDGAVRHDSGKPLKCDKRKLHVNNCGKSEQLKFIGKLQAVRKHKKSLSDVGCGFQLNQPKDLKFLGKGTNRIDRYRIPEELIFSLFQE